MRAGRTGREKMIEMVISMRARSGDLTISGISAGKNGVAGKMRKGFTWTRATSEPLNPFPVFPGNTRCSAGGLGPGAKPALRRTTAPSLGVPGRAAGHP
jgi:hypothetical protein